MKQFFLEYRTWEQPDFGDDDSTGIIIKQEEILGAETMDQARNLGRDCFILRRQASIKQLQDSDFSQKEHSLLLLNQEKSAKITAQQVSFVEIE